MVMKRISKFSSSVLNGIHSATHHVTQHNPKQILKRDNIPIIALVVGVSALTFQIGVLYPWHEIISNDFRRLQESAILMSRMTTDLDKKLDRVMQLEEEVKAKERKVLEKEDEILQAEKRILQLSQDCHIKIDRVVDILENQSIKMNDPNENQTST